MRSCPASRSSPDLTLVPSNHLPETHAPGSHSVSSFISYSCALFTHLGGAKIRLTPPESKTSTLFGKTWGVAYPRFFAPLFSNSYALLEIKGRKIGDMPP